MPKLSELFQKRLREHLEGSGLSQNQVAKLADVSQPQLNRYITGVSTPSIDVLEKISTALGLDPAYFISVGAPSTQPLVVKASVSETLKADILEVSRVAALEAVRVALTDLPVGKAKYPSHKGAESPSTSRIPPGGKAAADSIAATEAAISALVDHPIRKRLLNRILHADMDDVLKVYDRLLATEESRSPPDSRTPTVRSQSKAKKA